MTTDQVWIQKFRTSQLDLKEELALIRFMVYTILGGSTSRPSGKNGKDQEIEKAVLTLASVLEKTAVFSRVMMQCFENMMSKTDVPYQFSTGVEDCATLILTALLYSQCSYSD